VSQPAVAPTDAAAAPAKSGRDRIVLQRLLPFLSLIILFVALAIASPHFSANTHSDEPIPIQLPRATSNSCTNTLPTSCHTHSSKI